VPELPEVEVVRRGLGDHVVGRTIDSVQVHHPRSVRRHAQGAADFAAQLAGATVEHAHRRGKYLWLPLRSTFGRRDTALIAHLGMSGQLLVLPRAEPDETHLRIRFTFADDGPELRFVDQRTFGALSVSDLDDTDLPEQIAHIARDPLDPTFDDTGFTIAMRTRRTGIKRAILDQTLISGVGNIYADEALWYAKLHWARQTRTLTRPLVTALLAGLREVMTAALAVGGTSFDSLYVDVNGVSGYFERGLEVYGREGEPCRRCGTAIRRDSFMNRSSYTCPRCQPRPRRPHL
jgi:formamidopyrimidine-DNA glycosylase